MATANFKTMKDFPLIVATDEYMKVCPECGCTNGSDEEKCCECGCDLKEVESVYDDISMHDRYEEMMRVANALNEKQKFYEVSVESGYYSGLQFYVEDKFDDGFDNDDCQYEFGMCRSLAIRKHNSACKLIQREFRNAVKDLGLTELVCIARFSNGEAMYTKVEPKKPIPLKVAVKASICA